MPNNRRRLVGRVVSNKMSKTIVVAVDVAKRHRLYDKVLHQTHKYYAHDEENTVQPGDAVNAMAQLPEPLHVFVPARERPIRLRL